MGSLKAIKKSLKSKAGRTKQIPANGSLTVRFLDEPQDFNGYYQHWFKDGPRPCVEDDCEGCADDDPEVRRKSFRYLANAYVVDDQKVEPVELPKSLVEQLVTYYEKKATLLDRDYELTRTGSGMQGTKYLASPDSPTPMNLKRFKKLNLDEILASMVEPDEDIDDDEDEDDEPITRRHVHKKASSRIAKRRAVKDEENPWDDDDDDEEEEPAPRRRVAKSAVKRSTKTSSAHRTIRRN